MKKLITNNHNLKESDITEVVRRVKVLIINSNNEVLLGYAHNNYQFPGGHVEKGEELAQTANREVLEETGMNIDMSNLEPFACAIGYHLDWPEAGKNRKTEIYYYEVKTDEKPNLENTKYTEDELAGNFKLRYIPLNEVEKVLNQNANQFGNKEGIVREMLDLFAVYKNEINK